MHIQKRILVTGGAGFIGSNLVRLLIDKGHTVNVLDSFASGYRSNLTGLPISDLVVGDVSDASMVDRAMAGTEVVFHLAASVGNSRSIDHPFVDATMNVIGTLTVLEGMRRHGLRKIVFSSSAGIFGELKSLPIREDHPVEPDSPYGATKLCAEKMCLAYAKLYGIEAVCLRYFNVYGVRQRFDAYGNVIPIFAHRLVHGEPITIFGDGEQTRDFINVADVALANFAAGLNHGVSGAFNLGSGSAITINHLVETMQRVSGRTVPVHHDKPRKGDVRHSLADVSAMKNAFGWEPSAPFDLGITDYMGWATTAFHELAL
jgi:UDP-glucose 4-epimerase